MTPEELKTTGKIHELFITEWLSYGLAFKSGLPFIEDVLYQHPAETAANHTIRVKESFNFPYCQNIVSIYNYFLTEKPAIREIDSAISERPDWKAFHKNCDLYGTNFDVFLNEAQKLAGAYGTSGILIDFPSGEFARDEESDTVYPYCSLYTPNNILDWEYERDLESGKPRLTMLKLKEGEHSYLIWTLESWEKYKLDGNDAKILEEVSGENVLGEIPFVWLPNVKSIEYPYLGVSDIVDASRVNAAIIRTLSMGNEVMKYAGFPMLLFPYESENAYTEDANSDETVTISESSVIQFDPDAKNGKPSWLESAVEPSIDAILKWMDRLTEEMYRAANLAGLHQNRDKAQTKSATYLRYQFSQTNSVLSKKAESLTEAELKIYYFWAKWQNIEDIEEAISLSRIKEFSVDSLQIELENMISSSAAVMSDFFKNKMQRRIAQHTYPDLTQSDLETIEKEIEQSLIELGELEKAEAAKSLDTDANGTVDIKGADAVDGVL